MVMRIVGGIAKGRKLRGATISEARPTSELVRGAIFNVLGPLGLRPTRVIDLYAGSGSLGTEALSRGATWADFVERHPRQCAAIKENLTVTEFSNQAQVYCMSVDKALNILTGPYQLVLMDPPYKLTTLGEVLDTLAGAKLLEEDATVVVGHSKRLVLAERYQGLVQVGHYRYGDSVVDFFRMGGP